MQYKDYNCDQIAVEIERVGKKANELYHRLDKKAGNDKAQMAVGLILFWPTLFLLEGGDGPEATEYSHLKGELEALETVSTRKKCGIEFPSLEPQKKQPIPSQNKEFN